MVPKDDWRRMGQETYLMDAELQYIAPYIPRSETWEHEHCEFCTGKISPYDGDLHNAYCTTDEKRSHWICPACFDDFKNEFKWTIQTGFELKILDLHWATGGKDNPEDQCLHGNVFVRIGDEILDEGTDSWTVSAGAYRMLESVYSNHRLRADGDFLPCCGFSMFQDERDKITIMGCSNGIDWSVTHEGGMVRLITGANTQVTIPLAEYKNIIFAFADTITSFYETCSPKTPITEAYECNAHQIFWSNWEKWRDENYNQRSTPMQTVILYATKHGATQEIARRIATHINGATIHDLKHPIPALADYDCVILGSSLYAGSIRKEAKTFLSQHADELQSKTLGLFLSGMETGEGEKAFAANFPPALLQTAKATSLLGGIFDPKKAGAMARLIMKAVTKQSGYVSTLDDEKIKRFAALMSR